MNFKGRIIRLVFEGILGCFFMFWSNSLEGQTPRKIDFMITDSIGYQSEKEVFDSLCVWLFTKEKYAYQGLLSELEFTEMTRLTDSVSPPVMVHGQYMQYRFRVFKGIEKAQKKARKWNLKIDRISADWKKRISYENNGIYKMKRVEVPTSYRDKQYIFRFEALMWKGRWYHVGALGLLAD